MSKDVLNYKSFRYNVLTASPMSNLDVIFSNDNISKIYKTKSVIS